MIFEREGRQELDNPTPRKLASELKKLKSYGKSSFASLTSDNGSYLQVAGGGVGCLLEWRDNSTSRHFRAYLRQPRVPFEDGTELVFTGGRIKLRADEWLHVDLVIDAFTAFLSENVLPPMLHWRDISALVGLEN